MAKNLDIGFLYPDDQVTGSFCASLAHLLLVANPVNHVHDIRSGPDLAKARNTLVETFLKETTDRYLLMLDSDMRFEPGAVLLLHDAITHMPDSVIGGYCVTSGNIPTLYTWEQDDFRDPTPELIPDNKLVKVDGTGAACLMIPRYVLAKLEFGTWFDPIDTYSEDLSFCLRLREVGVDVGVHTGARFGHVKTQVLWPPSGRQV